MPLKLTIALKILKNKSILPNHLIYRVGKGNPFRSMDNLFPTHKPNGNVRR
jgi:hypothetical protein